MATPALKIGDRI